MLDLQVRETDPCPVCRSTGFDEGRVCDCAIGKLQSRAVRQMYLDAELRTGPPAALLAQIEAVVQRLVLDPEVTREQLLHLVGAERRDRGHAYPDAAIIDLLGDLQMLRRRFEREL